MLLRQDRARIAIAVMLDIAFHAGRGTDVAGGGDVAERLGAAKRGIEPIFQALSRANLLESIRGPRGGYRLARRARDIRLWDVVAAITEEEGEPPVSGKLEGAVVAPLWAEMEAALRERLGGLTIEDLLRRAELAGLKRPTTEPLNFAI